MAAAAGRVAGEDEIWIPLLHVAHELGLPAETVRITAEIDLAPDAYDPAWDMVSERGRQHIRDTMPANTPPGHEHEP